MRAAYAVCLGLLMAPPAQAAPRTLLHDDSEITFRVTQMGVAVSGRFERFAARIDWAADDPAKSSAEVSVDIASLTTGDEDADAVALDKPWLDLAAHPQAHFRSVAVRRLDAEHYEATGTLTVRGRSRPLKLPFTLHTQEGGATLLEGEFAIHRTDFGIGGGEWNEGDLVADLVPVHVRLRLAPP